MEAQTNGAQPMVQMPLVQMPLVQMKDISIAFGGIKAVDHADLELFPDRKSVV